ncbi:helix-turn-helix domain-containing protein [Bifidobacterium crudilactis]|jgi:transcriptional regulator with XRE-family HTH domain|uniref:helix-turn-helix domain-containing protein n=1 Tax=Bifidobacterium crudilactis TaxID=327277 RepID=UPI002354C2FA|nr:helix-turn-helix transcriptional regulator [Bifidobacterium crudilactis]MCI1218520.1 helix-turn-helix transcriptional regulator [Bifidobacterium crudilactis]
MTEPVKVTVQEAQRQAQHTLEVVSFNVQHLLTARNVTQRELGEYLGLTRSAFSMRLRDSNWRFEEVLLVARFFNTSVDVLTDDTVMRVLKGDAPATEKDREYQRTVAGDTRPRFFVGLLPKSNFVAGSGFEPETSGL